MFLEFAGLSFTILLFLFRLMFSLAGVSQLFRRKLPQGAPAVPLSVSVSAVAVSARRQSGRPHRVSQRTIERIKDEVIVSAMLLPLYRSSTPLTCFQLPSSERLFFISSTQIINQITTLETLPENPYTVRKQAYQYNQALLQHNPVSTSSLNDQNYVKEQYKLFVSLAHQINLDHVVLPPAVIHDGDLVKFVINIIAQVYLPMLLNIEPTRVALVLDDLIELLDLLERATGKHGITFQDYLDHKTVESSDVLEKQYIPLFHKIVKILSTGEQYTPTDSKDIDMLSLEIIEYLTPCPVITVITTILNPATDSRAIVNNILSWIDNMLNIVHSIVNLIVLTEKWNHGVYTKEFYHNTLPTAKALATMFMRHVLIPFEVTDDETLGSKLRFEKGDILMMSNGNQDNTYGGAGRKCPSRVWSHLFMNKIMELITTHYLIQSVSSPFSFLSCVPSFASRNIVPPQDSENNSWFWNKFSPKGIQLIPKQTPTPSSS